ncbi:hypothetical protein [Streptosporangium sp. NPDC020145]|uniref:hypothetical protein n=1 Tax=Streptosporangium sp. NPDC020145 TaxID=3154694 RepID=UPI00343541ED
MSEMLSMPPAVRRARGLMWVQTALCVLGLLAMLALIGMTGARAGSAGGLLVIFLFGVAQTGALGWLAAALEDPRPWVKWTCIGVESILAALRIPSVLSGDIPALIAVALALVVIGSLTGREARQWFG